MSQHRSDAPPLARKSSGPWDRLRPVRQDPLDAMGFVSKGDERLLDVKVQESFYHKIVARYMQFCTRHKKDLDTAFASLSLTSHEDSTSTLPKNQSSIQTTRRQERDGPAIRTVPQSTGLSASKWASNTPLEKTAATPEDDLSTILMALRKLREGLLATSSVSPSPEFSQRVHIFNVRVAVLAMHPPSYHPSLIYLLNVLHTQAHPLSESDLREMTTYMILDLALRQNDLVAAWRLKHDSHRAFHYQFQALDSILRAVLRGDWVLYWKTQSQVDGYVRAMMRSYDDTIRKSTLKVFGRAYMKTDLKWLLRSLGSRESSWDELIANEGIGWSMEGVNVIIRKPKIKK